MIAFARLGALPAVFLALLADSLGRRRLLVATMVGMAVFSLATASASSATSFVAFQACVRMFATLEEILAVIFALELLPARHRGWGVGFLAAMGGLGSGLGALLYGSVEQMPGGWRGLYVIGGLAILYVAWLRRKLPESPMFEAQEKPSSGSFFGPLKELLAGYRADLLALVVIAGAFWFPVVASLNFMSKYLQNIHGYSPGNVSVLFIAAGTLAIFGNILAGRVSDVIGRRPTLAFGLAGNCVAFIAFYNSSGAWLPVFWIAALFTFFVVEVIVNAISGELFPTSCRSTAASLRSILSILAGALGLATESALYTVLGSHAAALSLMAAITLLALPAVAWWLRETANRPLI